MITRILCAAVSLAACAGEETPAKTGLYPLDTCLLSGKKLGSEGEPVLFEYQGRELRFTSKTCVPTFLKDPKGWLAKIDGAIIAQQLPSYPLETCLVSGDKLGGKMGEGVNVVIQNRLVRLCCEACRPAIEKDPAQYLAKIDKAIIAAQKPAYPLDICPVTGGKLGSMGEPFDYVFAGRLVRFCCKGCVKEFGKDPAKYMAKIDEARKKKPGDRP